VSSSVVSSIASGFSSSTSKKTDSVSLLSFGASLSFRFDDLPPSFASLLPSRHRSSRLTPRSISEIQSFFPFRNSYIDPFLSLPSPLAATASLEYGNNLSATTTNERRQRELSRLCVFPLRVSSSPYSCNMTLIPNFSLLYRGEHYLEFYESRISRRASNCWFTNRETTWNI